MALTLLSKQNGKTAMDLAMENGREKVAELLKEKKEKH
jgi:ankyrin repeat protein